MNRLMNVDPIFIENVKEFRTYEENSSLFSVEFMIYLREERKYVFINFVIIFYISRTFYIITKINADLRDTFGHF